MTLTVNGEDIPFNLENFVNNAQSILLDRDSTTSNYTTVVINGKSSSFSAIGDMKFYLDGEEITEVQIKELSPDVIASITVDKQNNAIRITSKK